MNGPPLVRIRYRRLPDREEIYEQHLVHTDEAARVTLVDRTPLARPVAVDGAPVLEPGAPAVWFTFPGAWHDIGRFHLADGTFTGLYANVITPVRFLDASSWETTDLFLDLWLGEDGAVRILDADEFEEARAAGWLSDDQASAARAELDRLQRLHHAGAWPPAIVHHWTLERARAALRRSG